MMAGAPPTTCGKKPKPSEWSATTRKSSGRESFTGCPVLEVTSSPRANWNASAGPSRAPNAPASIENAVCRCVSPKKGRVGNERPAYGEYGGLLEKVFARSAGFCSPASWATAATGVAPSMTTARHHRARG